MIFLEKNKHGFLFRGKWTRHRNAGLALAEAVALGRSDLRH